MLVRSASRRQQRRTSQLLANSFAQLNLPWLAPAQLRWSASQTHTPSSPSTRDHTRRHHPKAQVRTLATAADQYTLRNDTQLPPTAAYRYGFRNESADRNVPWAATRSREPSNFPYLGPQKDPPIVVQSPRSDNPSIAAAGFKGTARQLLAHLYTTLKVGRRDRAAAIVQRVTEQCGPAADETLYAHQVYLEDLLRDLIAQGRDQPRSQELLKDMQRWFEVELRSKNVNTTPKTLVIMLRAAIRSLDGSRRERSIRRYVDLSRALGHEAMDEVLSSEDFDDNEHAILGRALPDTFEVEEEELDAVPPVSAVDVEATEPTVPRQDIVDMETVPEVRSTEQKGIGLESIKRSMETFTTGPQLTPESSLEARKELAVARQLQLEQTSIDIAIERWRKADDDLRKIGIKTHMQSKPVGALMWQWYGSLLPALEKELAEVKQLLKSGTQKDSDRQAFGPYLELLPLHKIAATTILTTMARMNAGKKGWSEKYEQEVKLASLATSLADSIASECTMEPTVLKRGRNGLSKVRRVKSKASNEPKETEDEPAVSAEKGKPRKKSNKALLAELEWPADTKVKLGAMLISKLIESAHLPVTREDPRTGQKVTQMQPAFLHRSRYSGGKRTGLITPNRALVEKLQSEPVGSLIAKRMPMVVEPRPWSGWSAGGYLHYPSAILRLPSGDRSGKEHFHQADKRGDLDKIYKGLTALGQVPWKIQQDVFKVQLEAWNSGEEIANFAPLNPDLPMPPEPETAVSDPAVKARWTRDCDAVLNKRAGLHSKRCFQNFQMEIARTTLNETLYFPHNMDFRGRAYPIPPYLNHMGADNVRGLLTFADGKELGETGLRWLKIHLATCAGHDKASMEERVEYTMAHLDDIYDSVRNPLGGRRWWLESEDAWQTLAACFELTKALDSPDPTKFVSHLPVQQDGTCNGLQHYAALGGDKAGAQQVNLEPSDRPSDVYTAVLRAVEEQVEADAKNGHAIASILNGRLTRKCVKQPVMTNVYGVTFYGARLQVAKQLEDLFPEIGRNDPVNIGMMAHYVATLIFRSLGKMFEGAQAIQAWLGQCADRISTALTPEQVEQLKNQKPAEPAKRGRSSKAKATEQENEEGEEGQKDLEAATEETGVKGKKKRAPKKGRVPAAKPLFKSTVVWTTPLRLPVVQPYRKSKAQHVNTKMQRIALMDPQVWDPVSKRKQLQAFPPNFIHSLDATHMLLSATQCSDNGMTFASIHDSFWTHACDVNRMSEVLRDAFVVMHKEDIVGRLKEEFQARYKGCMYLATVTTQSSAGQKVQELRAAMKKAKTLKSSELALETERLRLMESEDPEERAKGEAMVTPGSIVAAEADESAFGVPTEMAGQSLGEIPGALPETLDSPVSLEEGDASTLAPYRDTFNDVIAAEAPAEKLDVEAAEEKKDPKAKKLFVWLPLTFPAVPKKGDFKVERLLESQYFFH